MFFVLLGMNWQVALLSLLVVPFLYWVNNHYSNRIVDASERVKMMEGGVINLFHEVFTSIRVVKAFGRESHEQKRFQDQGSATLDERIKLTLQESLYAAMINVVTTGGTTLILLVGGYFVYQKRMTIGDLLVALTYLASVFGPLVTMSHTFGTAQASVASARRVLRLERIDRREKRWSYQQIETLEEYVLVAQDRIEVTVFRRANGWRPEVLNKPDQSLALASLEFSLPLSGVYEGVKV